MLSDMELIKFQAAVLFRYDGRGRMLALNESEPDHPAPRLFLGRTVAGNIWRFRHDLPDSLIQRLDRLLRDEPITADLSQPPSILAGVVAALEREAPIESLSAGPAWRFPDPIPAVEGVVPVTEANLDAMQRHYPWTATHLEELQPCRAIIVDGEGVSVCFSSRISREAAEAGVDTVGAFRGRGYAPAVVAAWASAVREAGLVPLYSTSWDNLASRAVARKLGLILYGADLSIV